MMDLGLLLGRAHHAGSFTLLLSHLIMDHEPVLCEVVNHVMNPTGPNPHAGQEVPPNGSNSQRLLLFAFQKTAAIYQRLFAPVSQRILKTESPVQIVDVSDWLQSTLCATDYTDPEPRMTLCLGDKLLHYVTEQISQFHERHSLSNEVRTIIFDNIIVLVDLGVPIHQLDRLITRLLQPGENGRTADHLVMGCHVGELMDDSTTSESEPGFAHWVDILKLRADQVIELRPLITGYTASIDGELSIRNAFSSADPKTLMDNPHVFHYRCEGKRVVCYPPGTSKLVT